MELCGSGTYQCRLQLISIRPNPVDTSCACKELVNQMNKIGLDERMLWNLSRE